MLLLPRLHFSYTVYESNTVEYKMIVYLSHLVSQEDTFKLKAVSLGALKKVRVRSTGTGGASGTRDALVRSDLLRSDQT